MAQLWLVMGGFMLLNFAIFTVGVDFYEEHMMEEPEEGTVEIYEVDGTQAPEGVVVEETQQAESEPAADEATPQ